MTAQHPLAVLRVASGEPGQLGTVGHAEFGVDVGKVRLDRVTRHEQFLGDFWIVPALAGKLS
jgi:hypothetical protein